MHGEQIRIFICDQSPLIRKGLTHAVELDANLMIVGEAADGPSALEQLEQLQPDVVLIDAVMMLTDGIETTRQIKLMNPDIKVLIFTSAVDQQTIFAALASGADGYCLKQTPIQNILQAIAATAGGAGWLDPAIAMQVLRNCAREGSASAQGIPKRGNRDDRFRLSPREIEVLQLLVEGFSNRIIAERTGTSIETIKSHMRHLMEKLQVADRTQAAVKALKEGIVDKQLKVG